LYKSRLYFAQPRSETFWNSATKLKASQIDWPRSENFWNLPTKVTQIDCICSAAQRKILEFGNKIKSSSN
jgi:hypothetical protein